MDLEKMSGRNLNIYIKKLEESIKIELDKTNLRIYTKWLNDARTEKEKRFARKHNYLKSKGYYDN